MPLVFALGWWWVTWPERTARRFVEIVQAQELDVAQAICRPPQGGDALWALANVPGAKIGSPTCLRPTWYEVATARRRFEIPCTVVSTPIVLDEFVATRNHVVSNPANSQRTSISYNSLKVSASDLATALMQIYTDRKNAQFVADVRMNRVLMRVPKLLETPIQALCKALDQSRAYNFGKDVQRLNPNREAPFSQKQYLKEIKQRIPGGRDPLLPR